MPTADISLLLPNVWAVTFTERLAAPVRRRALLVVAPVGSGFGVRTLDVHDVDSFRLDRVTSGRFVRRDACPVIASGGVLRSLREEASTLGAAVTDVSLGLMEVLAALAHPDRRC